MAKVQTITVGVSATVPLADFKNIKPMCSITYEIENDDNPEEIYAQGKAFVMQEVFQFAREAKDKFNK